MHTTEDHQDDEEILQDPEAQSNGKYDPLTSTSTEYKEATSPKYTNKSQFIVIAKLKEIFEYLFLFFRIQKIEVAKVLTQAEVSVLI